MEDSVAVLIVDDEPFILDAIKRVLADSKFTIKTALSGEEGLEILSVSPCNIVLSDYRMPGMNGAQFLAKVREHWPDTVRIVFSGHADMDAVVASINDGGIYKFILKPWNDDLLRMLMDDAAEQYTLRERNRELAEELARKNAELLEINRHLEMMVAGRTSELQHAKEDAEIASMAKTAFIANINHEIRTPLNAVIGFSEVLRDGSLGTLNKKQGEYLDSIIDSGKRLLGLILKIIDLSDAEFKDMSLRVGRFSLKEMLVSSMSVLEREAAKNGIKLVLDMGDCDAAEIYADRGKVRKVVHNLLGNAIKFSNRGSVAAIRVRLLPANSVTLGDTSGNRILTDTDYVEVAVEDSGIGIRREDIPKLFSFFTQLESPFTKRFAGIGVGLALARKLIELHGGSIRAESELGKGSRFIFTIPVRQPSCPNTD